MWIEEVRQVIERLLRYWREAKEGPGVFADRWEQAFLDLEKALAAIPEEPEMMKLLRWLDESLKKNEGRRNYISAGTYQGVMRYIEREFDYKLPEEGEG